MMNAIRHDELPGFYFMYHRTKLKLEAAFTAEVPPFASVGLLSFASNFKSFRLHRVSARQGAMLNYCSTSVGANGDCREIHF
jgi:hypothetical protein